MTVSAAWLDLREPADATARAVDLAELARRRLPSRGVMVHDLGCGTGSMARWLAPLLGGEQHWMLHDLDSALLDIAGVAVAGRGVSVVPRLGDLAGLTTGDLAGADLVTCSALLDVLTARELSGIVAAVVAAGCPALLTLSVTGEVRLDPPHPLDGDLAAAFNDHQRRHVNGRRLLGPDAIDALVAEFTRHGWAVQVRPSPWRLGPADRDLVLAWLGGWLAAATETRPDLTAAATEYERLRRAQAEDRALTVVVEHADALAVP
jgi:SAM-dependent methyltransferase